MTDSQDTASGGLLAVEQRHREAATNWMFPAAKSVHMEDRHSLVQAFARFERDHNGRSVQ